MLTDGEVLDGQVCIADDPEGKACTFPPGVQPSSVESDCDDSIISVDH